MGFAENVKFEMDFQDIQIKELSIKTGISKNTLDKYLFGKKVQPGVENAVKIANALAVSVEYSLPRTDAPADFYGWLIIIYLMPYRLVHYRHAESCQQPLLLSNDHLLLLLNVLVSLKYKIHLDALI